MPNDLWYFAYGSNLDLARKQTRTGAIRESRLALLSGYRLAFNKKGSEDEVYANLLADPTEETLGVIYRCTPETLDTLDRFEGAYSGHYQRMEFQVRTLDGEILSAIAYVARAEVVISESKPSDEYFGYIMRGGEIIGFLQIRFARLKSEHSDEYAIQANGFGGPIKWTKGLKTIGCIG